MVNKAPTSTAKTATTTAATQRNQAKHSTPIYFSDALFRNKRLKQKRLKWALAISKGALAFKNHHQHKNIKKTDFRRRCGLANLPPDITINLLSDDECEKSPKTAVTNQNQTLSRKQQQSLPQLVVFPTHMQISQTPNITLIPVKPLPPELAATLKLSRNKHKRKSQKPKRLSEPTIVNRESIVLSDESNDATAAATAPAPAMHDAPVACSTPNHLSQAQTPAAITPLIAQVDEEVTVSLVPRSTTAGSCNSKTSSPADIFPMVPDETTVQTIISNRIYELSLSKLREGLACSGSLNDEKQQNVPTNARRTNFNVPTKLEPQPQQPVALKLSSDLSISLISDDEDDIQHIDAEKLLRHQPHLSVRPVGVVTVHRPPKRRKLG